MSPEAEKVIRRACARFKTGIRKPFFLLGEQLSFEPAGFYLDAEDDKDEELTMWCEAYLVVPSGRINALDGTRTVWSIPLKEVTPEAVWGAYLQSQVDAVHAL